MLNTEYRSSVFAPIRNGALVFGGVALGGAALLSPYMIPHFLESVQNPWLKAVYVAAYFIVPIAVGSGIGAMAGLSMASNFPPLTDPEQDGLIHQPSPQKK